MVMELMPSAMGYVFLVLNPSAPGWSKLSTQRLIFFRPFKSAITASCSPFATEMPVGLSKRLYVQVLFIFACLSGCS